MLYICEQKNFRMKIRIILLLALLFGVYAQKKKKNPKDVPLIIFPNKDTISVGEFEYAYQKNNGGYEAAKKHSLEDYKKYIDMFVAYKRKVLYAHDIGLDTTKNFKKELNDYVKQLSQGYLVDKETNEKLLQEAIKRSKTEILASHIMIKISPNAKPEDTLRAYQKLLSIRDSIVKHGKSFEEMALKYSQDPTVKYNKGNVGYFTVFDMVYPFENAAYNTKEGEVSMPFRTQYGYHIVKVHKKLPVQPKKRTSHIIVRWGPSYAAKTKEEAEKRINEIYKKLQNGADFAELAKKYSDDPRTAQLGGDLGYNRLIPEMDSVKKTLKLNEISKPFLSPFGYHILKVTDIKPLPSEDELRRGLANQLKHSPRVKIAKEKFIQKLKAELGYSFHKIEWYKFLEYAKKNYFMRGITPDSLPDDIKNLVLAEFNDTKITAKDLWEYKNSKFRLTHEIAEVAAKKDLDELVEKKLLEYETKRLPYKYPDYKYLYNEYKDGILLFSVMDKEVWKKAAEDKEGLKKFYEANRDSFIADERFVWYEFSSFDSVMLGRLRSKLMKLKNKEDIKNYLDTLPKDKTIYGITAIKMITPVKSDTKIAQKLKDKQEGSVSNIEKEGRTYRFVLYYEKRPKGVMPFEEAKPKAITLYQNELEKRWTKELEKKYPVKINKKALKKYLFK